FPILDADFGGFDLTLNRQLIDLCRLGERIDLFLTFYVTHLVEDRRDVDQLGMGKRFADLPPRAVENRSFRRACPFHFAEAGDADAAALEIQLFQTFHNGTAVI